ncbi:type II toxin-antitoxin system VapC family toxin [Thioalkalivibrio sp. ALJ24]|uniref:type II toxin-antitoxin system VapC family toxin n=1 Tax=Thioalkalivibrio sp. ALJ24 TaxID=545276 RepID=UPI00037C9122|nr:type II toxin-antitoxin system VapC family toxin [Thioalkalivibrio sp. ALJ24]
MKYALDTNTLIYFFKGQGKVAQRLLATAPGDILVPTIVVFEIQTGINKSSEPHKRQRQLDELLDVVTVIPFDREAADQAARIRAVFEGKGVPIAPMDTLIAASALVRAATLVTHNTGEFQRIPDLQVTDWFE